jgi:hypothetical protein
MGCFTTILFLAGGIFVMVSLIRWFEQATEAVQYGWWNKVFVLLACPFTVWFFPSRIAAGRPNAVPHHEPVRGFGSLPKSPPPLPVAAADDQPPPGTPQEFIGPPKIPRMKRKSAIDPEKFEKLRQKMRDQGMLPPES